MEWAYIFKGSLRAPDKELVIEANEGRELQASNG
jgi:hypothetical protein